MGGRRGIDPPQGLREIKNVQNLCIVLTYNMPRICKQNTVYIRKNSGSHCTASPHCGHFWKPIKMRLKRQQKSTFYGMEWGLAYAVSLDIRDGKPIPRAIAWNDREKRSIFPPWLELCSEGMEKMIVWFSGFKGLIPTYDFALQLEIIYLVFLLLWLIFYDRVVCIRRLSFMLAIGHPLPSTLEVACMVLWR